MALAGRAQAHTQTKASPNSFAQVNADWLAHSALNVMQRDGERSDNWKSLARSARSLV